MAEEKKVSIEKTKATGKKTRKTSVELSKFFKETVVELKKVVWPTKRQLFVNTTIVIVASILMSLFITGFDWVFNQVDISLLNR